MPSIARTEQFDWLRNVGHGQAAYFHSPQTHFLSLASFETLHITHNLSLLPHSSLYACVFSVPGSVTMCLLTTLLRLWGVFPAAVVFVASYSPHQQQWNWFPLSRLVLTCCQISSHTSQGVIPVNHHLQDVIFLVLLQTLPHILHLLDKLSCHQMSLFFVQGHIQQSNKHQVWIWHCQDKLRVQSSVFLGNRYNREAEGLKSCAFLDAPMLDKTSAI